MKRKVKILTNAVVLGLLLSSCLPTEEFPPEPAINYQDFTFTDQKTYPDSIGYLGTLKFDFTDGDGDVGLTQADTAAPFDFNLFITFYEKIDGKFLEIEPVDTTLNFFYRIPNLTPRGQNKSLKGTIAVALLDPIPLSDTLKIEFFIKDRALNESNVEMSSEIVIQN